MIRLNYKKKCDVLERRVELYKNKISRLEHENDILRSENRKFKDAEGDKKTLIDEIDVLREEYETKLAEVRELKDHYEIALRDIKTAQKEYEKKFKELIKNVNKRC